MHVVLSFVVVNLQATPYDKQAALVIRARVDRVMSALLDGLGLSVPPPPTRGRRIERSISETKASD